LPQIKTLDDDHFWFDTWETGLEVAFKNVLQFGNDTLMKQVIELVQGKWSSSRVLIDNLCANARPFSVVVD
jgi:hypothetical protein